MFNQVVGSGANAFLVIIACIAGFITAVSYLDFRKVKKEENEGH